MSKFSVTDSAQIQIRKRRVSELPIDRIVPQIADCFTFRDSFSMASAGSCFAHNIADALRDGGYSSFITDVGPAEQNFGRYFARYGQLAQRAGRTFAPSAQSCR